MLGSGELPGLTWTWEEIVIPPGVDVPPEEAHTYRYEVRLYPTGVYIPPEHFLGFRLTSRKPLPWFAAGVEAFLARLSPTLSWDNFPLVFEGEWWEDILRFSFFAVEEKATQEAFAPCDLLLLTFLELWLSARFFTRFLLEGDFGVEEELWCQQHFSPEQALTLVAPGPLGVSLTEGEERTSFLTTPGEGLFTLPPSPSAQGLLPPGAEGVAVAVLLHLLDKEEGSRAWEVVEAYRRWATELPGTENLYDALKALPWDSSYEFSSSLWQDLLHQEGEKALSVGRTLDYLYLPGCSTLPPSLLLAHLLEAETLTLEEMQEVADSWYGEELSGNYRKASNSLIFCSPFRLLQEVEAVGLPLSPEERCRLWQALTGFFLRYPGPDAPPLTHRYLLTGGDLPLLLPKVREALGLPALVHLLLTWPSSQSLSSREVEELLSHSEWWDCPPTWWLPLLTEAGLEEVPSE